MVQFYSIIGLLLVSFISAGCTSSLEIASLKAELQTLKKAQQEHRTATKSAIAAAVEERDQLRRQVRVALARTAAKAPAKVVMPVPIADAPSIGPTNAWVTMVVFSEYECPFCARVSPTVERLLEKYKGKIKFVFRHLPLAFHPRARPAANAAECARAQGKFWQMSDRLFSNQRNLTDAAFVRHAKRISGLKFKPWETCYKQLKYDSRIARDIRIAADVGARGTPTFFVNGIKLSGAQPYANFESRVESALSAAQNSGLSVKDYYRVRVLGERR